MDPLCHTLVGASLAGTRLGERSWGAAATLVVAANLPDVDVVAYAWGSDAALGFRRGWTHGVLAIAVLPLLLAAMVSLVGRWRGSPGVRPPELVLLSYLGLLTHPTLDWLNTYGMRWAMPFDGTWSYGDALFIVDPWLWLVLGAAAFLRFSGTRRAVAAWLALAALASLPVLATDAVPVAVKASWATALVLLAVWRLRGAPDPALGRRACVAALAVTALYAVGMLATTALARQHVAVRLERSPQTVFAGPVAAEPTRRDVLVLGDESYRPAALEVGGALELAPSAIVVGRDDPRVTAALAAPCVQGMVGWLRYPWFVVEEVANGGSRVHLLDARYARSVRGGFGMSTAHLDAEGRVTGCV